MFRQSPRGFLAKIAYRPTDRRGVAGTTGGLSPSKETSMSKCIPIAVALPSLIAASLGDASEVPQPDACRAPPGRRIPVLPRAPDSDLDADPESIGLQEYAIGGNGNGRGGAPFDGRLPLN